MIREEPLTGSDDPEVRAAVRLLGRARVLTRAAFRGWPFYVEDRDTGNAVSPRREVSEAVVERMIAAGLVRVTNGSKAWTRRNGETVAGTPWRVCLTEAGETLRRNL